MKNLKKRSGRCLRFAGAALVRASLNVPGCRVVSGDRPHVVALPIADQLKELRAALSLNGSQLARILQVSRLTTYEWYDGRAPNRATGARILTLLRVLARGAVSGAAPLNARFVRQPMSLTEPSLLDLLCEDRLDQERLARAIERVRSLGDAASRKRKDREDRLRALGFEDLSRDQRKALLARNMALRDWPRR